MKIERVFFIYFYIDFLIFVEILVLVWGCDFNNLKFKLFFYNKIWIFFNGLRIWLRGFSLNNLEFVIDLYMYLDVCIGILYSIVL